MPTMKYLKETAKYLLRSPLVVRPYVKEVERLYAMSPEELRERNERRFLQIFRRAYDRSPFYRKLYTDAGIRKEDIQSLDDLPKLPIVTKDMVRRHADEVVCCSRRLLLPAHTSGTTASPLKLYESWSSIWWEQAYNVCYRKLCGFRQGEPLVSLRGNLDARTFSLRVDASHTLFISSYNLCAENAVRYHQLVSAFRPRAIEGYPSALHNLALLLREKGLSLAIPLAFTSSESILDHQRQTIEAVLGCKVYDHFGMTERTISLHESPDHQGYFEAPGYSINEYVPDGEICTSLINRDFPLIRYHSHDIMQCFAPDEMPMSRPQPVVRRIEGRESACIVASDGTRYNNAALTFLFKFNRGIDSAQFVQEKAGEVELHIVPNAHFRQEDLATLQQTIATKLNVETLTVRMQMIQADELIYSKRGKLQLVVSKIHRGG